MEELEAVDGEAGESLSAEAPRDASEPRESEIVYVFDGWGMTPVEFASA